MTQTTTLPLGSKLSNVRYDPETKIYSADCELPDSHKKAPVLTEANCRPHNADARAMPTKGIYHE